MTIESKDDTDAISIISVSILSRSVLYSVLRNRRVGCDRVIMSLRRRRFLWVPLTHACGGVGRVAQDVDADMEGEGDMAIHVHDHSILEDNKLKNYKNNSSCINPSNTEATFNQSTRLLRF